jgi:hypothetical protein
VKNQHGLILLAASCAAFASCRSSGLQQPWDLARASRPMQLAKGQTIVRGSLSTTEGNGGTSFDPNVALSYGVGESFTLGASLGQPVRGSTRNGAGQGDEVGALRMVYGIQGDAEDGGFAGQLDIVFEDGRDAEFRPSAAGLFAIDEQSRASARLGFSLEDGEETRTFLETAYWRDVGLFHAMLELDANLGPGDDELYVTPGVNTQFRDIVQLQFGAPIGLTSASADWQLLAGLLFSF